LRSPYRLHFLPAGLWRAIFALIKARSWPKQSSFAIGITRIVRLESIAYTDARQPWKHGEMAGVGNLDTAEPVNWNEVSICEDTQWVSGTLV
jgi:hypothetical protein